MKYCCSGFQPESGATCLIMVMWEVYIPALNNARTGENIKWVKVKVPPVTWGKIIFGMNKVVPSTKGLFFKMGPSLCLS